MGGTDRENDADFKGPDPGRGRHRSRDQHIIVFKGDLVKKGQQLTEGPVVPHEILEVCGPQDLQEHLVNEVQEVYRLQGVEINDKHIEIIVRQMLRKVKITDPGDTSLLWGDQVDRITLKRRITLGEQAVSSRSRPVLLGITKARSKPTALSRPRHSRIRPAAYGAATLGKVDRLRDLKRTSSWAI